MNLAAKYRPQSFSDMTEQTAVVDILKKICSDSDLPNRNFLLIGPAGTGKAQPLYSKVLTPKGFIKMSEVKEGTKVIDGDGFEAEVTGVYPQGSRPCYSLKFDDNTEIHVADNHLNCVTEVNIDTGEVVDKVLTTEELIEAYESKVKLHYVRIQGRDTEYSRPSSFVHPYLVGVFAVSGNIQDDEIVFDNLHIETFMFLNSILDSDWACKLEAFEGADRFRVVSSDDDSVKSLINEFSRYFPGLLEDSRYLPDSCLGWSVYNRSYLLEGLSCRCNGDYWTCKTEHHKLSQMYSEIANSLGKLDIVTSRETSYPGQFLHITKPVMQSARRLVKIEPIGDVECQCIMVSSSSHTYVTDNYTVTHNTTLGRIISKQLNDGNTNGVIEIDAASHSGADAARDITTQARAYPVGSNWKCFIIDECHSISSQGWQVLLKTLEESPAKSIFVLCTTNPEKIPATILSRVQPFSLSKISIDGITKRLKHICDCEISEGVDLKYDEEALTYIAKLGNGGMRDSIQLLDRAIAYSKEINVKNLAVALDLPNYDTYFSLLNGIAKKDNSIIVKIINEVYDSGTNFVVWFEGFHSFVCQIVKYIYLQDINQTMIPSYYKDKIAGYGANHAVLCLRLANRLLQMNHSLKTTNYLQEVAITHLCFSEKR